ncbi:MAG: helix-turn-helix domain-containing protein [Bacteroides sp.]|nr:helix-turn-helix domain-containing protein [Bacillota bacterium]MCM1394468.1 helix-turn-helix domain-containing protein [[Eubacterium] siraeum]MCM1455713.1 helix-turn-helix domain-containing protein [Bacteroides sp.]
MKKSQYTQVELAKLLKINQATISSYLTGRRTPSLEMFANLCAILDLDTNDILCIDSYTKD